MHQIEASQGLALEAPPDVAAFSEGAFIKINEELLPYAVKTSFLR